MDQLQSTLAVAVAAFASTNIDDLLLLSSLFVDSEFRTLSVIAGHFLGMLLLVGVSILASLFTITISSGWVGLLGFAPLFLGMNRFWKLLNRSPQTNRTTSDDRDFVGKERVRFAWARSEVLLITLLTVANGGENLSVYIPLFTVQRASIPTYSLVFVVMTALWCLFGYYLARHSIGRDRLKRYGRFVIPFVLIAIGLNILRGPYGAAWRLRCAALYLHSRHFPKNSSEWRISENPYCFSIFRSTLSTGQESIITVTCPHSVQMIWS
jgi:cadmium resistance protein CadD (predicted permease)